MSTRVHLDPAGFGIVVPSAWPARTDVPGLALVLMVPAQDGTGDNVGVIVEDTAQPALTLEQYVGLGIERAPQQVPDFQLVSHGIRGDASTRQGVVEYTGRIEASPCRFLAVVVLGHTRAFTATYSATGATFERHRPVAEPVLHSLFAR